MDDEKEREPAPAEPAPAEPAPAEPAPAEPAPADEITKIFSDYKQATEKKLEEMQADFNKKLKEREDLIKSLLGEPPKSERQSVAEKINATRNYKKW